MQSHSDNIPKNRWHDFRLKIHLWGQLVILKLRQGICNVIVNLRDVLSHKQDIVV